MQIVTNHPAHILNKNGNLSTSSFIPFCSFGEDLIGAKVSGLEIPVCNIFKAKNHHDQLCYETDLQELKDTNNEIIERQIKNGLVLFLDYNEERQIDFQLDSANKSDMKKIGFTSEESVSDSASLHLNTIGKY